MSRLRLTTYQDVVEHLVDYLGGATSDENIRWARRSIQDAVNHMPALHQWSYLVSRGRVTTVAPQTGTLSYVNSTLTATIDGTSSPATWPSWVTQGVLVINNIPFQVATNPTTTTLTLAPQSNPGADQPTGTQFTLYQDSYSLPFDFTQCDEILNVNYGLRLSFEHAALWMQMQRIYRGPATPRIYSIFGSTAYLGSMSLRFYPPPDAVYFMDFIYKRRPRQLNVVLVNTGTVSTTSGSLTVTGSGTSWNSGMIGSTIRLSAPGNNVTPTGPTGENPFDIERSIVTVPSTTSLTVDADPGVTESGISYAISDPLDIEEGSQLNFFLRLCEKMLRMNRRMKATEEEMLMYKTALVEAQEADSRSSMRQAVGGSGYPRRLRDFPQGQDMGVV